MIRHIVAWNYKDEFSTEQNAENAATIKAGLEALTKYIDGILELKVYINMLPTSGRSVVLNSLFENEEALAAYQEHPEHKKVASYVGSVMCDRVCLDYVE